MHFSGSTSLATSPSPSNTSTPLPTAVISSSVVGGLVAAVIISFAAITLIFIVFRRRQRASTSQSSQPVSSLHPFALSFESISVSPSNPCPPIALLHAESGPLHKHLLNTYRASKRMIDVLRPQDRRQVHYHGRLDSAPPTHSEAFIAYIS